ncbi:MAG: orotate phosphoribosyltransferase [Sandaracinaceae bacterium]|nr:orotate phosphoribosyltransferase [Sandaracinaceae bacterium]
MDRLLELLTRHSFARRRVVLASGKESDFFIDCKQTVLLAEGHALVGERMLAAALRFAPRAVAGVELGGCPLASAVSLVSFQQGTPLDAIYVRKEIKAHGSQRALEGDSHLADGSRVVVLEDVVTTGGSTIRAVQKLRDRKLDVAGVVALVDRREGGAEALAAAGLPLVALFAREDFIP